MKRSLKYFSILLAIILVLTGCGNNSTSSKKDAKEQLNDAIKKTNEANSFSAKFGLNLEASSNGSTMSASLTGNGDFNLKDNTPSAHYTANMSLFGMAQEIEGYVTVKDNKVYTYSKSEGDWTYSTSDYKAEDFSTEKINTLADNAKEVKSVKSDKSGYTKLEVTIDKEKLNSSTQDVDTSSLLGSDLKFDSDIVVNVYLKDGYVSIVEIDLADLLKGVLSDDDNTDLSLTAKVTIELSNFSKVSPITIPDDVLSNAKEEKSDYDFDTTDYDFSE